MNYKKLILVGGISAFVAVLTSVLGVAGTIIGSVISSVLYNMLSEALEKPMEKATFSTNFEWEIAYIFPLAVIALIQLLLIFALLSGSEFIPDSFLTVYLSLQDLASNNLYKLLGVAMLVISAYPLIVKPDIFKKSHGIIIAFVGLIFLARGFVDFGNIITNLYSPIFENFDLPIAIVAFVLILFVIIRILMSAKKSEMEFRVIKHSLNDENFSNENINKHHHSKKHKNFDYGEKRENIRVKNKKRDKKPQKDSKVKFKNRVESKEKHHAGINKSSENIHFESNDILDDYKK